ncbi:MAG TPA: hypothetical protein VGM65_07615 [Candidatus Udaeobacter sp.]|jgi:hypothetical protein
MKMLLALALTFISTSLVTSLAGEEIVKDKSPDGKFALRIEGWNTEIIESATKKKVIDLENLAGHDATLIWSGDSQRVAYFNESRELHTTTVYYRKGSTFTEIPLPEFPRCDEVKDKGPEELRRTFYTVTPKYWQDSGALFLSISGEWETSSGQFVGCEQDLTIAFDAQHQASVQKAEKRQNPVGRKIESPNGTFFVEELDAPAKDDDGLPRMDQEVWIVSAKDPATRERLPGFYEEEGNGVLNSATISPDENWIVISQHHGSHLNSTYLMRRKAGLKFEDAFPDAKWPAQEYPVNRFDNAVWKFFSQTENVPTNKIDANELGPTSVSVLEWSEDSGRLLLYLYGGLTGDIDIADRGRYKKPGISGWFAYYNTKTGKFELTERLRKANAGARKRWTTPSEGPEGFLPPYAESIGHEGDGAPVAERLKKYETQLASLVKKRESQLEGVDRAKFQKKEKDWGEELEKKSTEIRSAQARLGFRTRSTWDHLIDLRQDWLPVYEQSKTDETKGSQP